VFILLKLRVIWGAFQLEPAPVVSRDLQPIAAPGVGSAQRGPGSAVTGAKDVAPATAAGRMGWRGAECRVSKARARSASMNYYLMEVNGHWLTLAFNGQWPFRSFVDWFATQKDSGSLPRTKSTPRANYWLRFVDCLPESLRAIPRRRSS